MSFWVLLQILVNIIFLGVFVLVWIRLNRPQKDDPRMSRGLQLLQSKIAVLEDLSDRTEVQVNQLTTLLEQKCKDIQNKIFDAEDHIDQVNQAIQKSMEVARIFQDKIPHKEIIERQNTVKFVKAAKLAHQGYSVEQIAAQVDLSKGEVEFIAKMNKDRLMVSDEDLPDWAKEAPEARDAMDEEESSTQFTSHSFRDMASVFEAPKTDKESLKKLGEEFRKACQENNNADDEKEACPSLSVNPQHAETEKPVQALEPKKRPSVIESQPAEKVQPSVIKANAMERDISIRPVEFRKIDLSNDLG